MNQYTVKKIVNTTIVYVIKMFYTYRGIKLFNELPNNIKITINNRKFKLEIKKLYAHLFH